MNVSASSPAPRSVLAAPARVISFVRGLFSRETRQRYGLRARLALTMVCLSAASCLVLGLCSFVTYEITLDHIIRWHVDPIVRILTDARARGASPEEVDDLARTFYVRYYDGASMPVSAGTDTKRAELVRVDRDRYAFVSHDLEGRSYAVVGKVEDLDDIEEIMLTVALFCVAGSLLAALVLSWWLSRKLVTPLLGLTDSIRAGESLENNPLTERKDEVGLLSRAFVDRERSLRDFLAREQLFTGDVSHELRTPLTVVQGGTEILEARLGRQDLDPPLLPVVQRMQRTLESMTGTVATMLLLARTPEQLEKRTFDMSALARNEDEFVTEILNGRPIEWSRRLPESLMVSGNPDLATLVLHNILDNACRYTKEGSIVLELDGNGFTVTDTAPPIAEDVRERMFERGIRGASKVPGSGLGLSLVQRGCERLGWSVRHEIWEKGNRFTVSFRPGASSAEAYQGHASASSPADGTGAPA